MNHFERVMAAIDHQPVDRHPNDIWCVEEVRERLMAYCGVSEWIQVYDALDIDGIMGVAPPYVGPALPDLGENLRQDEWGMVYRRQQYLNGAYWEQVGYPLSTAQTIADVDVYPWPDPEWYDYGALPDLCDQYEGRVVRIGYTAVFYYHNKLRGLELSMMDPALEPDFTHHLIKRLADFFYEYHGRCYEAAGNKMQCTQVTDDFGSQTGLLISKRTFEASLSLVDPAGYRPGQELWHPRLSPRRRGHLPADPRPGADGHRYSEPHPVALQRDGSRGAGARLWPQALFPRRRG